jgi:uncharacterized membrane protein
MWDNLFMKKLLFAILQIFIFSSCGKLQNSNTSDASLYGSAISGTSNFQSARTILSNKCFSCHANWSAYTETQYVSAGLVVAGSTTGSTLYTRIRGNDTGTAGDMPISGANLTTDEVTTMKTWIQGI